MASDNKGKYVVLFTSGNFVFFKHKNDKGIYCPKSILNSQRTVLKDDIYELQHDVVNQRHHKEHPDMPEAAVFIATRAKFVKTPRVIIGVGTMKKISGDGEYGFVEYQDGRNLITAFCTRITVKPTIDKGAMHKFFTTGGKVKFVAKEQPPSGMYNIEWRIITATDMKHDICPNNFEKVTPAAATVPVRPGAAPAAAAAVPPPVRPTAVPPTSAAALVAGPPPGLPPIPVSNGGVSASSSSSSVVNGVSFAARAASQLPEAVAAAVHRVNAGPLAPSTQLGDETLPATAPDPRMFRLSEQEKNNDSGFSTDSGWWNQLESGRTRQIAASDFYDPWRSCGDPLTPSLQLRAAAFAIPASENDPQMQGVYEMWPHYRREAEGHLEPFESELSTIRHMANCLSGGDSRVLDPVSFAPRVA